MAKTSCILTPEVNGKPSKLYKDLLKHIKNRPLVNWIYAHYTTSNMADLMDQAQYKRDENGQHHKEDVLKFIQFGSWQEELSSLREEERVLGAVDDSYRRVDFHDAKEALEKANEFNNTHKALVAAVYKHGDNTYNIIVSEKNSKTHAGAADVRERLKIWEVEKQAFNAVGIDLENMPDELKGVFNPYNNQLVQRLKGLKILSITNMYKPDALILFNLDLNSVPVQRLVQAFGSIDAAAQAVSDINHRIGNYTSGQKTLLRRAIDHCKNFKGLDIEALGQQIQQMTEELINTDPEELIKTTLHKLNKKYKIGINEIHKINDDINTLSDAAAEMVISLERQIRKIESKEGATEESQRLNITLNNLLKELANKKYYAGAINFLHEAANNIEVIDDILEGISQSGNEIDKVYEKARTLQGVQMLRDQYYTTLAALANEGLIIDEAISQEDIDTIRREAKRLKNYFDKNDGRIRNLKQSTMFSLVQQVVGDSTPDGQALLNAIKMAQEDSSGFDRYLYSLSRASNPLLAAMGSIIQSAKMGRDSIANGFDARIKTATQKLHKSGSNSEFMYEDDGHIISDRDWGAYKAARKAAISHFYLQGLRSVDLKQAINEWEENNTEERVVDKTNGRTERVPNSQYAKAFPTLTDAQQEYYDTMMQIKAEIGSMLPPEYQHQYLPPQMRRNMVDALTHAESGKDVLNAVKNKLENFYTVREDDTNYAMNGIIDGDEYTATEGSFDNTPLKQIPIFYVNKVDQGELLKEFSTGLQHLMASAINYDAVNEIADVVEFMGNYITDQAARSKDAKKDIVGNAFTKVVKDLWKWGKNNNTAAMVEGFINREIYGIKRDPEENKTWSKLIDNLVSYTSFKGLATNVKGMFNNYIVGEGQMLIEAGAGEFYGIKNYLNAHKRLWGDAGVKGEMMDALMETKESKASLFGEMFDPIQENFSDKSHTRYQKSFFRKILAHDLSFIGYGAGEFLIHYVNMYAILDNEKVKLNGKKIDLYSAFEKVKNGNGVNELRLKDGVTQLDGTPVNPEYIDKVRRKIRYCNQTCHGSMNEEDKGLITMSWYGRLANQFRQWMWEHYSRRFRGIHFDGSLGMDREGYWVSLWKANAQDSWEDKKRSKALVLFARDLAIVTLRAQTQWSNLNEMQRYNVKRVAAEMRMFIALVGLSFALGEPDKHKKEFWRRWWIYQTKRMIIESESGMPWHPKMVLSGLTMLQSPMASINTFNGFMYAFYGIYNGDFIGSNSIIKSGKHKGDWRYGRNMLKYVFPVYKDIEQLQNLDEDDSIFQVFKDTPSGR